LNGTPRYNDSERKRCNGMAIQDLYTITAFSSQMLSPTDLCNCTCSPANPNCSCPVTKPVPHGSGWVTSNEAGKVTLSTSAAND